MCTDISNQPIVTTSGLACVTFPYISFNMGYLLLLYAIIFCIVVPEAETACQKWGGGGLGVYEVGSSLLNTII